MGPPTDPGPSGSARVSKWSVRSCLCTLLCSHTKQCAYSEAQTQGPIVKHTQHTINPLIAPHV
ncbi:unnamed protein product, partial [Staurois parvus]